MVKRAKLAAKKAKKLLEGEKAAPAAGADEQPGGGGPSPPQHIQRKLTRKVKFLERVAATKLSASKGGVAKKKKRKAPSAALTDLSSLTASLQEAAGAAEAAGQRRQFGASVGTQRGREKVAEVEGQRLQQVLAHPEFQANPLAAVASHLAATVPTAPPKPLPKGQQKDAAALRREKKKRRKEQERAAREMEDD